MGTHRGSILDSHTLALFRMDEASASDPLTDAVGSYSSPLVGTGFAVGSGQVGGKRTGAVGKWHKKGPVTYPSDALAAKFDAGDWTVEFWIARLSTVGSFDCPFVFSDGSVSFGRSFGLFVNTATNALDLNYMTGFSAYNYVSLGTLAVGATLTHYAVRSTRTGGTQTIDVFRDGVSITHSTGQALTNTSSSSTARFLQWNGESADGGSSPYGTGNFDFDDWRFSDNARTDAEILTTYKRGAGTCVYAATASPSSGTTGTAISVTGENFNASVTATLGGTAATVTYVDSTHITITAPAHAAGLVDLVLTDTDGTTDTLAGAFTYATVPTITSVTPDHGPSGTSVAIVGTNFVSGAVVDFDGVAATTTFVDSTHLTATAPAHVDGLVDVTVTNPDAQDATATDAFTFISVKVLNFPTVLDFGSADQVFGVDVGTFPDLAPDFAPLVGPAVVLQAVARRFLTARGQLAFHDDYGLDLRGYVNEGLRPGALSAMRSAIEREAERDERVVQASADLTYDPASQSVAVVLTILTGQGPFKLVLDVSALDVTSPTLLPPSA